MEKKKGISFKKSPTNIAKPDPLAAEKELGSSIMSPQNVKSADNIEPEKSPLKDSEPPAPNDDYEGGQ